MTVSDGSAVLDSPSVTDTPVPSRLGPNLRPVGVAVIGCGYWGPNLIRNFNTCDGSTVIRLCDQAPANLERAKPLCPTAIPTSNFRDVLADPTVEAVAIATPVATHAPLAAAALRAGKHVL